MGAAGSRDPLFMGCWWRPGALWAPSTSTPPGRFCGGATPETIAQQYPSLTLADVYAVIGYYLNHHPEIYAYLQQRDQAANRIRQGNESRFDPDGIREPGLMQSRWS